MPQKCSVAIFCLAHATQIDLCRNNIIYDSSPKSLYNYIIIKTLRLKIIKLLHIFPRLMSCDRD